MSHLSNINLGIGFVFVMLFLESLRKSRSRNAALFSIMCLSIAIFVIGYGFELQAKSFEELKFFLKVEYFGAPFMTVFWFLFSYKFYYNKNASFRMTILIMIIPVLTMLMSVTNEYHHLLYTHVDYHKAGEFVVADLTRGIWYYFYSVYSYAIILFGGALFFKIWRHSKGSLKIQAFLMFFGMLWPVLVNVAYLVGLTPDGIDFTPFGLLILAICYSLALFEFGVLEIQEIIKTIAFSEIDEGILVIDEKHRLLDYNAAAQKILPELEPWRIGSGIEAFCWGNEIIQSNSNPFVMEREDQKNKIAYEFRGTEIRDKKSVLGHVYFFHDITKQRQMIERLDQLASYDALSQVYNRRKLMEEAEKESLRASRYYDHISVLMIDIDLFKRVNDRYGHLAGDEVIKTIAGVCKEHVRSVDVVGRYGGEEFVIILSNADQGIALKVAETLRLDIQDMITVYGEQSIAVTVSIGVSTATKNSEKIDLIALINEADEALYRAKANGRNQVSL